MKSARVFSIGFIASSLLVLGGCMPRGETKTLEEVFVASKARFEGVQSIAVPAPAKEALAAVVASLDGFASGDRAKAGVIAQDLNQLIMHTGFTSRPAMGELMSQYRVMAASAAQGEGVDGAQLKLLASRTYGLLAAELETTKFGVE